MKNLQRGLQTLVLIFLGSTVLVAQDTTPPGGEAVASDASVKSTRFEVVYQDDSAVRMQASSTSIEIATKYGMLTIPLSDIRSIRMQPRLSDATAKKIADAIVQLGDKSFSHREAAVIELRSMGVAAFPHLRKAAKSSDAEIRRRASELIDELERQIPEDLQAVAEHDIVETVEFVATGRVLTTDFTATSSFLGDVKVVLAQLKSIRSLEAPMDGRLDLDAARYAQRKQWMETDFAVEPQDKIQIVASGEVDLYPRDGEAGNYMSTPVGNSLEDIADIAGSAKPGTLVGRIGPLGKQFAIGESYSGRSKAGGKLFLRIVQSPLGACAGSYRVKVKVTKATQ